MATIAKGPIEAYTSHKEMYRQYPVAASQTILRGSLLVNSSGYVALAGADPTAIVGFATEAVTSAGVAGVSFVGVGLLIPPALVVMNIGGAVAAVITQFATAFGVEVVSTNWAVDTTDTTNTRLTIVDFDRRDAYPPADTNGRVVVKFLNSALFAA